MSQQIFIHISHEQHFEIKIDIAIDHVSSSRASEQKLEC